MAQCTTCAALRSLSQVGVIIPQLRLFHNRVDADEPIPESGLSLLGFKARIAQQGITELDLAEAGREYREARERLRAEAMDSCTDNLLVYTQYAM
jgi:hypothetical protein